ncbi:epidermal growth factor receptor kinase substrate 8-like protein 3 isoform X3 [Spea bombifrons]|uniref:epidermal growth factor receptor kinase substrate 8-like protein 3 isoform X3 n=1 Tax=Spea bombifrons TaxID=233779 RepID=UPI0023490882|nr:epidermal growth factor receptor kinase substrate 8-like protein 3 isoform X3 [Spea bombifrons]
MNDYISSHDALGQKADYSRQSIKSSRPSAKNIYEQRKQYAQSLTKAEDNFQHRVEHLLTYDLDDNIHNVEECLNHLRLLDAEGRIWGQDLLLQVKDGELMLNDMETRDSLERIPLQNVQSSCSVMGYSTYNSILTITIQDKRKSSIFLFQCDEHPADILHTNLEKALTQWKGNHKYKDVLRNNMGSLQTQNQKMGQFPFQSVGWESPKSEDISGELPNDSPTSLMRFDQESLQSLNAEPTFQPQSVSRVFETQRDIEVLNHVLQDIEIFIGKLNNGQKKKKGKGTLSEAEFIECLQKIKYAFNLLGKLQDHMQQPSPFDLVHMLFSVVPVVLSSCPKKNISPSVVSPLPTQKALLLLSSCVTDKERQVWESLGDAWMRTRADWPNGKNIPQYIPTFSDGWILPELPMSPNNGQSQIQQDRHTQSTKRQFQPVIMHVLCDFEARNSRELSVRKGDTVKVLDQRRQWWMVENNRQHKGFIPSNILDSGDSGQVPEGVVSLQPSSSPEHVTAWLKQKGFSTITVRCLGVLKGKQLLELSRENLKSVCPEEGGRVFTQLNAVRAALGI